MRKTNQNNLKYALFWIWDNLHHLGRSVSFREAADHPVIFTKFNVSPQVFLCFIIGQMIPNCKAHHICALLHFLEMNFLKIVLVIILWNVMSGKRFCCLIMDQKAIDQLDCIIFPSAVSLQPRGCLEWL